LASYSPDAHARRAKGRTDHWDTFVGDDQLRSLYDSYAVIDAIYQASLTEEESETVNLKG